MKRILVCGAGGSPSTNFVRSLRAMDESVFLVGVDADPFMLERAETDVKILVPRASEADYLPILNDIITEYKIGFVHAQNDSEIAFLSEHRNEIHANLFLPRKETINICMDKFQSYESWEKAGIRVPKTKLITSEDDLKQAFKDFGSQLWLRNITGAAGNGSYPTSDYDEAVQWIHFQKGWGTFTAAERLTEHTVTWMSIWHNGELIVAQGRKRLYWELGNRAPSGVTGVTGAGMTYSDSAMDDIAVRTIKAIDPMPHGIFSVDMTYDRNGAPNPTEINIGRFFTTHYFFTKAGLNMPEIFVRLAYGETPVVPEKRIGPLPDGLVWVRGVDFEPVLTTIDNVEKSKHALEERRTKYVAKEK
ncbi:MAG: carboxylate--amine ligase [Candidatus Pacebacteria bacterium]|nr:carboxylate--amine ligase [Candidatus Paceibacterota bacterium]